MEKKILQTNQCPYCFNKIDIRAVKCDKCLSSLTTEDAQDKIQIMLEEQRKIENKKNEDEINKKNQQNSHKIKVLFYFCSFVLFIILSSLGALGYFIFFALASVFIIYQDRIFGLIDKNYKINNKNNFQKNIRILLLCFLIFVSLSFFVVFIKQATESPEHKIARQKASYEEAVKRDLARQKAAEEQQKAAEEQQKQEKLKKEKEAPGDLKLLIDMVKNMDTKKVYKTVDEISADLYIINGFKTTIKNYKKDFPDNVEIAALVEKLETSLKNKQVNLFPNLRKNYINIVSDKLWINDVEVKSYGATYNAIEFKGYMYATNKNIEESYSAIQEMLKALRFDRANFKWTTYGEYTYYKIESLKDNELN